MTDADAMLALAQRTHAKAIEDLMRVARSAGYDLAIGEPCWEPGESARTGQVVFAYHLVRPGQALPPERPWTRFLSGDKRKASVLVHSGAPEA